mmetsp:Transcript_9654/g.14538  ORF Transcript_9654/g.14538 Transcript_9654/m.14538 type:complete len:413 (-) Transcript_9654:574-1812(-)
MTSSVQGQSKYIILAATGLGVALALYFMRSRRKGKIYITKEKFILSNEGSSKSSLVSSSEGEGDDGEHKEHPEGPNIGFGSDPTWMHKGGPERTDLFHTGNKKGGKLVVVMVGLPGTGKTFIARKISRYMRWISYRTRVYSLAKYRLEKFGTKNADFFDPSNEENIQQRAELMLSAVEDAMRYLKRDGEIAIIDGANTTLYRRELIRERVSKEDGFNILWIENIVDPEQILSRNSASIHTSPDFTNDADFNLRMRHYRTSYETLLDSEGSCIKIYDSGEKIQLHQINGFLRTKIASFVMNIHTSPRTIYMVRAGESEFIKRGLIGGDSDLTAHGIEFANALSSFLQLDETGFSVVPEQGLTVWSSTMRSAKETARRLHASKYVTLHGVFHTWMHICMIDMCLGMLNGERYGR